MLRVCAGRSLRGSEEPVRTCLLFSESVGSTVQQRNKHLNVCVFHSLLNVQSIDKKVQLVDCHLGIVFLFCWEPLGDTTSRKSNNERNVVDKTGLFITFVWRSAEMGDT